MRYDRARVSLDRHATYIVAAHIAAPHGKQPARVSTPGGHHRQAAAESQLAYPLTLRDHLPGPDHATKARSGASSDVGSVGR
jgi:hypothetical protein